MAKQTREQMGVKAGDKIVIKGKVSFARLDKAVTGEALAAENKRRASLGMLPTKEFRSVTIEEPEVVQGANTPLANYYAQNVYPAKSSGKNSMSFESKSLYPPQYGHIQNGTIVEIQDPERNPAQGQVIYLMITAFAPKGFNNLGSTFDAIVYDEGQIKFYEGNNSLAGFGAAMNMPVETLPAGATAQATAAPEQNNAFGGGQQGGFGGAPVNQPNQNQGFGNAPAQQQGGFGAPAQGGFGAPAGDPNQPAQQGGFGAPAQGNAFGVQDNQVAGNQGSPFGGGGNASPFGGASNAGQPTSNPFA